MDGGLDAQTIRLEGNIGRRTVGGSGSGIIVSYAGPECIGACIEEPFSGQFSSVKARFAMRGAAVLARELAGLPWPAINLSRLKITLPGMRSFWSTSQSSALQGRFARNLARQGRVKAGMRLWNSSTSLWPVMPTETIINRAINPAMRLYSMAVAPDSSRRSFPNISCSLEL
jgi:hypothetical protein